MHLFNKRHITSNKVLITVSAKKNPIKPTKRILVNAVVRVIERPTTPVITVPIIPNKAQGPLLQRHFSSR